MDTSLHASPVMPSPPDPRDLEDLAARIADDAAVDWRLLARLDARAADTGAGLHELSGLAQAFRAVQVRAPLRESRSVLFRFAGLDVLEKLGEGAQGEVWRAHDPLLDQQVALKLRRLDSPVLAHQFLREGRQLARVRHANVVGVYGAAVEQGRAGLWMELVRGESLQALVAAQGPLPADEVIGVGLSLCRALTAVHRDGLVHGDIKAGNVLRDDSGRIVLTDFGAARDWREARGDVVVSGTLAYLAPEVLAGGAATPASDLYSLGVLLFFLASGRLPLETDDAEALLQGLRDGRRQRLPALAPHLPPRLLRLIERTLDLDPARRPAGAQALADALGDLAAPRGRRVLHLGMAAVGLAFAACVLGAFALWRAPIASLAGVEAHLHRLGPAAGAALLSGDRVAVGDRLALSLGSTEALWAYLYNDDGSGSAAQLFPIDAAHGNPVAAGTPRWLPGEGLSWQIDRAAVQEEFLLVLSPQPLPALESLGAAWQRPREPAAPSRGALRLAGAPETLTLRSAQLREVLALAQREPGVRVWHWQLRAAAP